MAPKNFVRVMSMSDPASLAIAQDILRDSRIPFTLSGAGAESVFYGPGNVALSASLMVEEPYVEETMELLQGLNGVLKASDFE
ncbi:MAG: hypothetical protein IH868_02585 [Chloroflexi bacterium]|nr:hypothetical protein [Chloroflexota bacterium]